ncbi:serine hydrolase domain-containing protein [Streptomyces specialis]|uniref:serine hydrolase domain-containing protein n=1 Tax=Streptomyces specialis TaxID=498367 RepID=UPI001F2E1167|nr:serine hydrolase domain-containing protein [Streptomyces specialis]
MSGKAIRALSGVALAVVCAAAAGGPATAHGAGRSALQRDADAIRDAGATGVQVRDGHGRVATSGVADLETGRPVSPHGYFRIGSTNKTLVATVVLQLVSEQKLTLDDPVETWLPGLIRGNGNDGRNITVRHLLQHTSGISDANWPAMDTEEQYLALRYTARTPEETVALAMAAEPESAPGAEWHYSNTGYVVLGLLIERVTGNAWHEEVDARVLGPAGMHHTVWPGDSPGLPRPHAEGYTRFAEGGPLVNTTELIDADASGGYLSTTADLNRFLRALFDGTLLDDAGLAAMRQTMPMDDEVTQLWPDARYGLGIFSRSLPCGGRVWIPSGDQLGYSTRTAVTEDGRRSVVVSVTTQQHDSFDSALAQERAVTRLIDNALCGDTGD